jgi:hypothetical protein
MGAMKQMIDELIEKKAQGNNFQIMNIKMKLMLKGVMVEKITTETPNDPDIINKIQEVARDFQVKLSKS